MFLFVASLFFLPDRLLMGLATLSFHVFNFHVFIFDLKLILFIQRRPGGLFPLKGRVVEA